MSVERCKERILAALAEELDGEFGAAESEQVTQFVTWISGPIAAVDARAVNTYEATSEWSADGHRGVTAGLRHACNESRGASLRRVERARKLRDAELLAAALADGLVSAEAADVVLRADKPETHDAFVLAEKELVDAAVHLEFDDLVKFVRVWTDVANPDEADRAAGKRDNERSLHASKTLGGQVRLDAWLNPLTGAGFLKELDRLEKKLFDADWAEARDRLGDHATMFDLRRTPEQRRHDAFDEMVRRSAAYAGDGPVPKWRVVLNVHMDYETHIAELARHNGNPYSYPADRLCEIEGGPVITPSEALGLALGGEIRRIVFGADGHVLDYGRTQRFFPKTLGDAVKTRDGHCQHPGCRLPAHKCQVDHVIEWHDLGETSEANGEAVCRFHNLWKTNNPVRWRQLRERNRRRPPQRE